MTRPDLSVVWASRDDDYAGGVNSRLVRSVQAIQRAARSAGILLELVLVDWNPSTSRRMSDFCRGRGMKGVRVIEVPRSHCARFAPQSKKVFLEYPAKNVGIRRAISDQVLVINPDVLVSKSLLTSCIERPHARDSFLRVDRTDFRYGFMGSRLTLRRHIRHGLCESDPITTRKSGPFGSLGSTLPLPGEQTRGDFIIGPSGGLTNHFLLGMHTNASGDFLCASKESWCAAGGFDESRWLIGMGDSIMVARLTGLGLRQVIRRGERELLHEEHPSDPTRGGTWSEEFWPDFRSELLNVARSRATRSKGYEFGLGDLELQEHHV